LIGKSSMALVAFSAARAGSQEELRPFERLVATLASTFSSVEPHAAEAAVSRALEDIGNAVGIDECTLIGFDEHGVSIVHSWSLSPRPPCSNEDLSRMSWVVQRLARGAVVAIAPEWNQLNQQGARLAVPLTVGDRVVYALTVASQQRTSDWPTPFVDRLRLAGEIIAVGLERCRLEELRRIGPAERALDRGAHADALYLQEEARNRVEADQIIGQSPAFAAALVRLDQVAPLDATVLLLGETGTGKELFARALHDRSRRRARTLIRVNCAALPASLIESELFGHERGAFTGAIATRQGRFELADGGTIFLDEIGDLAPELQAKLLRVLQEGEFERVGSSKTRRVDVRVIAATHINLEEAVAAGKFRADLYYRLSVFPISLPPLRERREDIPQLVWFLIHLRQRELNRRISRVPAAVMQALQHYDWPGNVRELSNIVERAMIGSPDGVLQIDALPAPILRGGSPAGDAGDSLDAMQRSHIERVLRECGGRINGRDRAAERLGVHPNTLRYRIKKLGVVLPRRRAGQPAE
jgi:transcriptional regulator with GAF, ATPase, and Fis domain